MASEILKSRKLLLPFALLAVASACFIGCTLDPYLIPPEEEYTRNFVKDFGLVDASQDWNLAKELNVSINLGSKVYPAVKVYAMHQDKYYLVASLTDISGKIDVPVDVPETCSDIMVSTGYNKYYGKAGSMIDCTDEGRGVPNAATYPDDYHGTNNGPAVYEEDQNGFHMMVQHTNRGNGATTGYGGGSEYQYFNTQQLAPIISSKPWKQYFSLNTGMYSRENTGNLVGILPESGVYNRHKKDLTDWIREKRNEGQSVVEDFRIATGDDGSFTLFPYYYGTNLAHELGVYLLDENNNPVLKNGATYNPALVASYKLEDFVSFPIFRNREAGDLQVQPHFDSEIGDIMLSWDGQNPIEGPKLSFTIGQEFDLQSLVYVWDNRQAKWMKYDDYIATYGNTTHSRVAYHLWVDEATDSSDPEPVTYATCSSDGIVTPLAITKDHENGVSWAQIGIATGMTGTDGKGKIEGRAFDFSYEVNDPAAEPTCEIRHIEIAGLVDDADNEMWCQYFLKVGETHTLQVTLRDADWQELDWESHFDELSVVGWGDTVFKIYKDESDKTIKVEGVGIGNAWGNVYVTETGYDDKAGGISSGLQAVVSADGEEGGDEGENGGEQPAQVKRRAPDDMESMLHSTDTWHDVSSYWSRYLPAGQEVASYPVDMTMLARSRGYDVTITRGTDDNGQPIPYKGRLGMYLKVYGSYDTENDGTDVYTPFTPYVVYSQKKFNKVAGSPTTPSNQISALSVKHPLTGRTFLAFEDMQVTSEDGPYSYWEKSSDRDVNDLIFNITNYEVITNDEVTIEENTSEDTFSWLWAVEDLGATDDFDFNDMVMKITSVTKNLTTKTSDGKVTSTTIYKKVTFTPLCAGGTLPIYIHYNRNGKHHTLAPGMYKEDDLDYTVEGDQIKSINDLPDDGNAACELHRWFGINDYTTMINTSPDAAVVKARDCVLYLKDGFTIEGFGSGSRQGRQGGLYVTVNDGRPVQSVDQISGGWTKDDDSDSWVIAPPEEGKVSQMFMIFDAKNNWRWPTERTHILNAYPRFRDWVNNGSGANDWYKDSSPINTFPRYDLAK